MKTRQESSCPRCSGEEPILWDRSSGLDNNGDWEDSRDKRQLLMASGRRLHWRQALKKHLDPYCPDTAIRYRGLSLKEIKAVTCSDSSCGRPILKGDSRSTVVYVLGRPRLKVPGKGKVTREVLCKDCSKRLLN